MYSLTWGGIDTSSFLVVMLSMNIVVLSFSNDIQLSLDFLYHKILF